MTPEEFDRLLVEEYVKPMREALPELEQKVAEMNRLMVEWGWLVPVEQFEEQT